MMLTAGRGQRSVARGDSWHLLTQHVQLSMRRPHFHEIWEALQGPFCNCIQKGDKSPAPVQKVVAHPGAIVTGSGRRPGRVLSDDWKMSCYIPLMEAHHTENIVGTIVGILMGGVALALVTYFPNRSRCTLEQAAQLSGCPENELQELIQARLLSYRRKYGMVGLRSLDVSEIPAERAASEQLKRMRAETDAAIRRQAEEVVAEIQERNRRFQEQEAAHQAEMEMLRRIHAEMLKNLRTRLNLIPQEVVDALRILGLSRQASFDDVYRRYRLLAKRYHPDTRWRYETIHSNQCGLYLREKLDPVTRSVG